MAKGNEMAGNAAADVEGPDEEDRDEKPVVTKGGKSGMALATPSGRMTARPGFFTIYKRGQGKWTRLGTIFAAAALGILTAYNLYQYLLPYVPLDNPGRAHLLLAGISTAFLLGFGLLTFWVANKPTNVDFLISTDSEMKKVNWTTKGELMGSTRVVCLFLLFIALFLMAVDLVFQQFFHFIRVLQ